MKLERLAGPPSSSETGRSDSFADQALLQRRLALLAGMSFVILFCFYLVGQVMIALGEESYWPPSAHAIYAAAILVTVGTWLYCRRGERPLGVLRAIDAAFTFVLAGFMLFMPESTIPEREVRMMVILQAVSLSLFIRSIFLPSTAWRTFGVSVLAATPLAVYSLLTETVRFSTWKVMWLGAAIAVSTAGSAVIWGLRRDVRRARRLGQYTLEEKLGEGGMGLVYRARHAMLRRPTAVKLLRPDRVGEASLRRFEREVQLTAGLSHPNTVSVYDFGRTSEGVFYYAMEYLDGLDLDQLVSLDGPQPPGRVVHVLRQVLGALGEAHGVGLVHRDIKPSNIILCERGGLPDVAKVVDFGLARDPEASDGLSREGAIIGTPLYLAPEAIRSPEIDGRSDLYSLGAVAFKILTAEPVFDGRSVVEVCGHHLHTAPEAPSKRLGRPLPPGLDDWVLACLEKDPARRPASAAEASSALDRCEVGDPWTAAQAREWWARRVVVPREPAVPVEEGGTATMEVPLDRIRS